MARRECKQPCMRRQQSPKHECRRLPTFQPDGYLPHLMKRVSHALDKDQFVMQGGLSCRVMRKQHKFCSDPKPELPRYLEDKQEVEAVFHLPKASALVGEVALEPPPPPLM